MTIAEVITWLVVGGAIGGMTDLFFHVRYGEDGFAYKSPTSDLGSSAPLDISAFLGLCALSAFIGISGAVGLQVVLIGIQKFSDAQTVENSLLMLAVSIIAGFGARRLLPRIRDRLEEEVLKSKEKSQEAVEEAQEAVEKSQEAAEEAQEAIEEVREARAQLKVLASLRPDAPASERASCIKYLTDELRSNPTERTNAITLGRLQRASGDLGSAVDTLTRFLEAKGSNKDKDYADALYNRACYNSLRWNHDRRQELLTNVISDLSLSFKLSPENKEDAERDSDFDAVRETDEFKGLF